MHKSIENIAKTHYENFPVGSFLIPKRFRKPIQLVYAFARVADDYADEGSMSVAERMEKISEWQQHLYTAVEGRSSIDFFVKLATVLQDFQIPLQLFDDLLTAFKRDVSNPEYEDFEALLEYCRLSANPIGRILLKIFGCSNQETNLLSDKICSALQLTNFWQDISVDTSRNRFYIPKSDFLVFNLHRSDLQSMKNSSAFNGLMRNQVQRTLDLFEAGKPLFGLVNRRFRFELKMIWNGGMRILEKIESQEYETRNKRPVLTLFDKVLIVVRSLS